MAHTHDVLPTLILLALAAKLLVYKILEFRHCGPSTHTSQAREPINKSCTEFQYIAYLEYQNTTRNIIILKRDNKQYYSKSIVCTIICLS